MTKLPFVWELNYENVISHAIGSRHSIPLEITYDISDLIQGKKNAILEGAGWLENKRKWEESIKKSQSKRTDENDLFRKFREKYEEAEKHELAEYGRIEVAIEKAALATGMSLIGLEDEEDRKTNKEILAKVYLSLSKEELREILDKDKDLLTWFKGDLEGQRKYALRDIELWRKYLTPEEFGKLQYRNIAMVDRSMPYFAEPSILSIGTGHFVGEPSMLDFYQKKGIGVKRLQ